MLLIGHRGASGYEPENTLSAFQKAIVMKCDGIELDVHMSKDHELVVIHDETLERTTSGDGFVSEKELHELQSLDAGGWYGQMHVGSSIPTLESVFQLIPKGLLINVEIKGKSDEAWTIEKRLLELVYKYELLENMLVSSFNHVVVKNIRMMDSEIRIGVLIKEHDDNLIAYIEDYELNAYSVHPSLDIVNDKMVKELKNKGYKVFPYTVNEQEQASSFMDMGVDGIFTDYPDLMIK